MRDYPCMHRSWCRWNQGFMGQVWELSSCSIRTMAKSGRWASISVAIASRIERQLHACANPQRPPSLFGLEAVGFCWKNHSSVWEKYLPDVRWNNHTELFSCTPVERAYTKGRRRVTILLPYSVNEYLTSTGIVVVISRWMMFASWSSFSRMESVLLVIPNRLSFMVEKRGFSVSVHAIKISILQRPRSGRKDSIQGDTIWNSWFLSIAWTCCWMIGVTATSNSDAAWNTFSIANRTFSFIGRFMMLWILVSFWNYVS